VEEYNLNIFIIILCYDIKFMANSTAAGPFLRPLVGELSPRKIWFDSKVVHVGFVVNRVVVRQVWPRIILLSRVSITPPLLTTR
jgi:hypothetical protein